MRVRGGKFKSEEHVGPSHWMRSAEFEQQLLNGILEVILVELRLAIAYQLYKWDSPTPVLILITMVQLTMHLGVTMLLWRCPFF